MVNQNTEMSSIDVMDRLIKSDKESPKCIMIIGDGMTDVYVRGHIEECQEECPKFIEDNFIYVPGGAGNSFRSIENWNVHRVLVGEYLGPTKTRYMVEEKCIFRYDKDNIEVNLSMVRRQALRSLNDTIPNAVLLSDYNKGLLTREFIREIVRFCDCHNIPCVADCKQSPHVYDGCIIKGNGDYFRKYAEQARRIDTKAISTLGPYPPMIWDHGNISTCIYRPSVKCINYVGSGDCFAAHLTLALGYGFSLKESSEIAYSAGRVYVQYPNNKPPDIEEIRLDLCYGSVGIGEIK